MLSEADMLVSNSTENRYPNIDYLCFSPILPTFMKMNYFLEYTTIYYSPVHLIWDLESLHLIQSLYFFSKNDKKITNVG